MNTEVVTQEQNGAVFPAHQNRMPTGAINQGSVAIEQERAIAEAQGQLVLAKRFPRDLTGAHAELMSACKSKAFAEVAFYSVPRAGGAVTGPSIRMAEEIARVYGNFQYGHRELSRDHKKSEVEVYAWDMERNNRSIRQLTVYHTRDTKQGQQPLRDQKDIDDKIANVASKQVRGRILALMPKWLVEDAIQECRKTIAGTNDEPLENRVRKMTQAFSKFGVTTDHLERYLGHKLDEVLLDELVDMTGIYNAIKEGAKASDYFGQAQDDEENQQTAAKLTEKGKQGAAKQQEKAKDKPADKPAASAEGEKSKETKQSSKEPKAESAPNQQQQSSATKAEVGPDPKQEQTEAKSDPAEGQENSSADGDSKEDDVF